MSTCVQSRCMTFDSARADLALNLTIRRSGGTAESRFKLVVSQAHAPNREWGSGATR